MGDKRSQPYYLAACNLMIVKADPETPLLENMEQRPVRILVPASGGPNTSLAMDFAVALPNSEVTALYITHEIDDAARLAERERWLAEFTAAWSHYANFQTQVIQHDDVLEGILITAKDYDLTVVGASNAGFLQKVLVGSLASPAGRRQGSLHLFGGGLVTSLLLLLAMTWVLGSLWIRVADTQGRVGWIAAEYVEELR